VKRVRLTMKQYNELVDARDWCARKGFESLKQWYDEELAFIAYRRALPIGVHQELPEEAPPRRGSRW
jgi:hypothetical protein